ncbi:GRASP55/65 PDZ-like domain-containing protein [Amylocystis lapponica]|nr:GRASP55/65 PDZ-like domain-containing protein [Amylocystis lapponica]
MGAAQSTASQAPSRALHVLRVTPSSPASETTIEPFFDFVVGFKGDSLSSKKNIDAGELETLVESHEGRPLDLLVWNSKSQQTRVVPIVPSRDWALPHSNALGPQEPEAERKPSLLGLSMRMCQPEFALDNVWHVLDVLEGSPAESAGLVPYGDWIIGWSGGVLGAEGDFYDIVEAHIEKPLRVYVYSYDFDTIREVVLVPNRQWGGEGLLGCVFGFGLLHRIPPLPADREPGSMPPELQDLDEYEAQQLFVPADAAGDSDDRELPEAELRWEHEEWMRGVHASRHQSGHDHDPERIGSPSGSGQGMNGGFPGHQVSNGAHEYDHEFAHNHVHDHHDHAHAHDHHHDHDHSHDHDHHHDHGLVHGADPAHDRAPDSPTIQTPVPVPVVRATPARSGSFGTARSSTPTPRRPPGAGAYMNMNVNGGSSRRS